MKISNSDRYPIIFSRDDVSVALERMPQESFGREVFDVDGPEVREILLLLSTPRSGSTFLSEQLRIQGGFVTHEYFNSKYGIPALAERWNCIDRDGNLDGRRYVQELCRNRTSADGRLGINLHGSHLPIYALFSHHFGEIPISAIRLYRRDVLGQAISLSIAKQSGRWSSNHSGRAEASYSFDHITKMVEELSRQNARLDAFEEAFELTPTRLEYDEFVAAPGDVVAGVLGEDAPPKRASGRLEKQRGQRNTEWRRRYIEDSLKIGHDDRTSPLRRAGTKAIRRGVRKLKRNGN